MALFGRRAPRPLSSPDAEQDRLRAIRVAAEEELGQLRRELAERVAAVESRERELADALARVHRHGKLPEISADTDEAVVHAQVALSAHAQELERRERELAARERAFLETEAELTRRASAEHTPEERLAHIEARLAALQEAEQAFAKTRAELAARSDELDRREAELADLEHAMTGTASALSRTELEELDERLSRLEQTTREGAAVDRGFGDALRRLETKGLRRIPPSS